MHPLGLDESHSLTGTKRNARNQREARRSRQGSLPVVPYPGGQSAAQPFGQAMPGIIQMRSQIAPITLSAKLPGPAYIASVLFLHRSPCFALTVS